MESIPPMRHNSHILAGVVGLTAAILAMTASAHAAQATIDQKNLQFVPNAITINAGDTVLFLNHDFFTHDVTVVSPDGDKSDKGVENRGQTLVVPFPTKGTFSIVCKFHPGMKATVTVK
jgi:plastocyanin